MGCKFLDSPAERNWKTGKRKSRTT